MTGVRRRGVALVAVLFATTLAGGLAVGAIFIARNMVVTARVAHRSSGMRAPGERVLVELVGAWDSVSRAAQGVGTTVAGGVEQGPAERTRHWITRLGPQTWWLVAESESGNRPMLRRRVVLLVSTRTGRPIPVPNRAWIPLP